MPSLFPQNPTTRSHTPRTCRQLGGEQAVKRVGNSANVLIALPPMTLAAPALPELRAQSAGVVTRRACTQSIPTA